MLLKVNTRTKHGETYLDTWHIGGKHIQLKRPFDPYFYAPSNPAFKSTNMAESIQRHCRQPPSQLLFDVLSRKFSPQPVMRIKFELKTKALTCMHDFWGFSQEMTLGKDKFPPDFPSFHHMF